LSDKINTQNQSASPNKHFSFVELVFCLFFQVTHVLEISPHPTVACFFLQKDVTKSWWRILWVVGVFHPITFGSGSGKVEGPDKHTKPHMT